MSDVPLADTCVCGVPYWHRFVRGSEAQSGAANDAFIWCKKCGCVRVVFEEQWQVPLDRAGDVARSTQVPDDERPTRPGTLKAKRGEGDGSASD